MDRNYLLRVANYEYFIYAVTQTGSKYKPPHKLLEELESEIQGSHKSTVLIEFTDNLHAWFIFNRKEREGVHKYLVYDFEGIK